MIFYIIVFSVWFILTLFLNFTFKTGSNSDILMWFVIYFLIELAIDAIVAFIVHKLPLKYVNPNLKIYTVYKFERRIYEKLKIKRWKDLVPESGGKLCNFSKRSIANPNDKEYVYKFLTETCYAELMHIICCILSFAVLFIPNNTLVLSLALPIAIINFLTQLLPVIIQRYTRPKLMIVYNRLLRKENNEYKKDA